jgi:hypothetical protein
MNRVQAVVNSTVNVNLNTVKNITLLSIPWRPVKTGPDWFYVDLTTINGSRAVTPGLTRSGPIYRCLNIPGTVRSLGLVIRAHQKHVDHLTMSLAMELRFCIYHLLG